MASTISQGLLLTVPLAPLAGALIAGLAGRWVGRRGSHVFTILGVFIAFVCSVVVLSQVAAGARFNETIYEWMVLGKLVMEVGFLVDGLTAMMMVVVTFVSLMVHVRPSSSEPLSHWYRTAPGPRSRDRRADRGQSG